MDNIIRVSKDKDNPYVMVNKGYLEDVELSFKAKGLMTYLLSRPNDWKVYISHLKKVSTDGRDSVINTIKELMEKGYIIRSETLKVKGKYTGYKYTVFESPKNRNGLTVTEKPTTDKPYTENPTLLINDLINNDITNIYTRWNELDIIKHNKLTDKMTTKIKSALKDHSESEIYNAFNNYNEVLKDDGSYFNYKWTLSDFLQRGLEKFLDDSCLTNFKDKNVKSNGQGQNKETPDFEKHYGVTQ